MGTAPIKDVMFSLPLGNAAEAAPKTDDKSGMFSDVLSGAVAKSGQTAKNTVDASNVRQADGNRMGVRKAETAETKGVKNDADNKETGDAAGKGIKVVDAEKTSGAIEDKVTAVKDAVKEELGVTDEEIEEAMAEMGLLPIDLLNADNLKGLMLELAGEEDPLALVTNGDLLESINNVMDIAASAVNELNEEFGITPEELADVSRALREGDDLQTAVAGLQVTAEPDSDDEAAETVKPEEAQKLKVIVNREDTDKDPVIRETSTESASMQKKVTQMMDDRKQEGQMQDAMPGQSFVENLQGDQAAAAPVAEGAEPYVDARSIIEQVTDRIKVNITEDATSMELQLHPASLGTVNLTVATNGGVVTANILVQNEAVKTVLEGQLAQLLQTFEEQGQKVEAIEVAVAGYDLDRSLNQGNEQGQDQRRERSTEGIGRTVRRRLNLNELTEEDVEDLTEEEQLAKEMMEADGTSVDFQA